MLAPVRPPATYRFAWSRDPAVKLPEDEKAAAEALRVARETGDWTRLLPDARKPPTWFVFRWVPELAYRRWWDLRRAGMGVEEALALLFLLALESIENFELPPHAQRRERDDRLREDIASPSVLDYLKSTLGRSEASALVTEMGACVFGREETTAPKS